MRGGRLGDEEAALRRRAEGGVPVRFRQLLDGRGSEALAGRVHEQVETAELCGRRLHERPSQLDVRDVAVGAAGRLH